MAAPVGSPPKTTPQRPVANGPQPLPLTPRTEPTAPSTVHADGYTAPTSLKPVLPRPGPLAPSSEVALLGAQTSASLQDAATRNTTGPEANLRRYVQAQTAVTVTDLRKLEERAAKLPPGPERTAVQQQIDSKVQFYKTDLALQTQKQLDQVKASSGKGVFEALKNKLPKYLRDSIDRRGIVIPGLPGAVVPRTDNGMSKGPTGFDWKIRF